MFLFGFRVRETKSVSRVFCGFRRESLKSKGWSYEGYGDRGLGLFYVEASRVRTAGLCRSVFGGFLKGSMAVATLGAKCSDMKVFRGSVKGVKGFGS